MHATWLQDTKTTILLMFTLNGINETSIFSTINIKNRIHSEIRYKHNFMISKFFSLVFSKSVYTFTQRQFYKNHLITANYIIIHGKQIIWIKNQLCLIFLLLYSATIQCSNTESKNKKVLTVSPLFYDDFDPNKEFDEFSCDKNEAELTELKKKLIQKKTPADRIAILEDA